MSKKNKPDNKGFVFSTDPNFRFDDEEREEQDKDERKKETESDLYTRTAATFT